jgi:hypothetical protein
VVLAGEEPTANQSVPECYLFADADVRGDGGGVQDEGERHVVDFGSEYRGV